MVQVHFLFLPSPTHPPHVSVFVSPSSPQIFFSNLGLFLSLGNTMYFSLESSRHCREGVGLAMWNWVPSPQRRGRNKLWASSVGRAREEREGGWGEAERAGGGVRARMMRVGRSWRKTEGEDWVTPWKGGRTEAEGAHLHLREDLLLSGVARG
jgi:hypothetical protein